MYGQLIEQAEKYLRSLYAQDNIAEQLKRLRKKPAFRKYSTRFARYSLSTTSATNA